MIVLMFLMWFIKISGKVSLACILLFLLITRTRYHRLMRIFSESGISPAFLTKIKGAAAFISDYFNMNTRQAKRITAHIVPFILLYRRPGRSVPRHYRRLDQSGIL
jgi:hypothetical protein